ncbi:MAG: hypothetical protein Q7K29_00990 [Thermoleophilia bacterium]|nr:hypothetical protein [Thermoleophilia bacterium]
MMLMLWFLPFWLLSPYIASLINPSNEESLTAVVTVVIMTIQTIIGLFGAYLAGKETAGIIKNTPRKHVFKTVWRIFRYGNTAS